MSRAEFEGGESVLAVVSSPAVEQTVATVPAPVTVKRPVLSASAEEWRCWMVERGYPAYRARQVLDWVVRRRAESFEPMSDLPKSLRRQLDVEWVVFNTRVVLS